MLLTVGAVFESVNIGSHVERVMREAYPFAAISPLDILAKPTALCPLKAGEKLFVDEPDFGVDEGLCFHFDVALNEPEVIQAHSLIQLMGKLLEVVEQTTKALSPELS